MRDVILILVLVVTSASVPGHFLRRRRYQSGADRYLGCASVVISLACAVSLMHEKLAGFLDEWWLLGVEIAAWLLAACAALVAFLVLGVTYKEEFRQRVQGLSSFEKLQFWLGFASVGNPPSVTLSSQDLDAPERRLGAPLVLFGAFLLVIGVPGLVSGDADLSSWLSTGGLILVVGGGIDILVRRSKQSQQREANERTRRATVRCRNCGYLLRGLPEPRCPECGEPFPSH